VLERVFEIGRDHQRWFGFASAPRPTAGWPIGRYEGRITVEPADGAGATATLTPAIMLH
jgi:hypothetical protein